MESIDNKFSLSKQQQHIYQNSRLYIPLCYNHFLLEVFSFSLSWQICMIRDNVKVGSFPISWDGLSISTNGSFSNEVAVGGQDNLIHIYTLDGNTLTEVSWNWDVKIDGFILFKLFTMSHMIGGGGFSVWEVWYEGFVEDASPQGSRNFGLIVGWICIELIFYGIHYIYYICDDSSLGSMIIIG